MNSTKFKFTLLAICAVSLFTVAALGAQPQRAHGPTVSAQVNIPLPRGHVRLQVGKEEYAFHRGVFYRPGPRGYVVVRAPRGVVVPALPPGYARIVYSGRVYFRFGDVFYQEAPGGYVVVDAPTAVVTTTTAAPVTTAAAPAEAQTYQSIWLGEKEYLFKDGQFFIKTAEGLVWQPAPVGAVTKTLPPDSTPVWYQDVEYFDCDGTIFRKTPDGYRVVPAPWASATR